MLIIFIIGLQLYSSMFELYVYLHAKNVKSMEFLILLVINLRNAFLFPLLHTVCSLHVLKSTNIFVKLFQGCIPLSQTVIQFLMGWQLQQTDYCCFHSPSCKSNISNSCIPNGFIDMIASNGTIQGEIITVGFGICHVIMDHVTLINRALALLILFHSGVKVAWCCIQVSFSYFDIAMQLYIKPEFLAM